MCSATEFPAWRRESQSTTSIMMKFIAKNLVRYESLPDKKRVKLGQCKSELVKEFVFQVAKIEGEGLDTLEEVGSALDKLIELNNASQVLLTGEFNDKAKLMSTLNLYIALRLANERSLSKKDATPCVDMAFILKLHKILGENTKDAVDAGQFRKGECWTLTTQNKRHIYMDPKKIPAALEQLIVSSNKELEKIFKLSIKDRVNKLLDFVAWFFYKFESIHPFRDGNGRVGRLLVAYLLSSIVPWGANNLYQEAKQLDYFVDKRVYLQCFEDVQSKKGDAHPADLEALLVEGIYASWLRLSSKM